MILFDCLSTSFAGALLSNVLRDEFLVICSAALLKSVVDDLPETLVGTDVDAVPAFRDCACLLKPLGVLSVDAFGLGVDVAFTGGIEDFASDLSSAGLLL